MRQPSRPRVALVTAGLAVALLSLGLTGCGSAGVYTVSSTADTADATLDGTCADKSGACTLRAALAEADADGILSTVKFNITGSGTQTINIGSRLPLLTEGNTTIDGYSQPGATVNTSSLVSNAVVKIEVRGTGPTGPEALVGSSAGNAVRGIAFYNLRQSVRLSGSGATGNTLAGNFIGTNAAGTFNASTFNSSAFGLVLTLGASNNTIGGPDPADRNVVSGNAGRGVLLCSPSACNGSTGANDNVIQGNLIGLTPSGSAQRANLGHGIDVNAGSSRNRIEGNVVSGNNGSGIEVSHGTTTVDNKILDNHVGTTPDGTAGPSYARNSQVNVHIEDGPRDTLVSGNVIGNSASGGIKINSLSNVATRTRIENNRIGISTNDTTISNGPYGVQFERGTTLNASGTTDNVVGPDNLIVGNGAGIRMIEPGTVRNTVTQNSIHDNTGLGIDLEPLSAVNPNDLGDADTGPNDLLNFPVLLTATSTSVTGTACNGCLVEIFVADSGASSNGEGETYLAAGTADGTGAFTVDLPPEAAGAVITATATDPAGNTSEFSRNTQVPS